MRKLAIGMFAVAIMATPALAELTGAPHTGQIFTATPDVERPDLRASTPVYDSWTAGAAGFFAAPPAVGAVGYDDYDTISQVSLTKARFVGGVTTISDINFRPNVVWFEFYDTTFTFVTSFGVSFSSAGNYLWTITFSSPPFIIPHTGFMQMVTNTTWAPTTWSTSVAGQFFMTSTDALLVGSNSTTIGGGVGALTSAGTTTATIPLIHAFRFDIPEPATLGLLGAGMLLVLRRRR